MDNIKELYELCETISNEIAEANEKIRAAGGKLSAGDMDYVDKLTHTLKSIKTTIAMMENEVGYSGGDGSYRMYPRFGGVSYRDGMDRSYDDGGMSYRGGSYARGRGRNARRDSMGRYSGDGYSRAGDDMVSTLHGLMQDAPSDQIRQDIQRLADKISQQM